MGRCLNEMCDSSDCISKIAVILIEEMRTGTKSWVVYFSIQEGYVYACLLKWVIAAIVFPKLLYFL